MSLPETRKDRFSNPLVAYSLPVTATAFFAASFVIARGFHETIPPIGMSFWRFVFALAILTPVIFIRHRHMFSEMLRSWKMLLLLSTLMVTASTTAVIALNFTTAINATLVNASQPTVTALISWIFFKDRLRPLQMIGILAALGGLVAMVSRADLAVLMGLDLNAGDFIIILAVVGWATYATNLHRLNTGLGLIPLLFTIHLVGVIELLPIYVAETIWSRPVTFNLELVLVSIVLAIVASLAAILIWNAAVLAVGANRASVFINLIPVFGAFFGIVFLGEHLYSYHLIGMALVCAGILLVVIGRAKKPAAQVDAPADPAP